MPDFAYKACDEQGEKVKGVLAAQDEEHLADLLAAEGLYLLRSAKPRRLTQHPWFQRPVRRRDLILLFVHLATALTGGISHALELNPKNLESYTNLGVIHRRLGRMPEAIRAFEAALSIDPEHAESHYNLALLLEGQGRIPEAVAHYRRFVASAEPRHRSVVARVIAHIQLLGQGTANPSATRKPLAE